MCPRPLACVMITAKRAIIEELGLGTFLLLSDLSLAAVERFFGDDKEAAGPILNLAEKQPGFSVVTDLRQ